MPQNQEDLIAQVGMDLDSWDDGMRQMLADERKIERILGGVVDSANDAEKALNDIDGSIDLDVDTSDLEKAKRIVEDIDGMDGGIDLSVDESELETVQRLINDIDSEAPTVNIEVDDSEVNAAQDDINDIDSESPSVDVNVDDEEVDQAHDLLQQIRDMQTISIVMNITGNLESTFQTLSNLPGIGSIVEMDNAMARFEGQTGRAGIQLENLVDDLHSEGIIAGRDTIGEIATLSSQLGIAWSDTDEAVTATLNTITVTGGDANETLTAMNNLVNLGLVDSFQEASDLIVTGFQSGLNRGGDFLEVLNEYGTTFSELGIDGQSAMSLINSGLEAGFMNADLVADAIREFGIRVRELDPDQIETTLAAFERGDITVEELTAELGEAGAALNELDLLDETEAFLRGEMSGEEFFTAVVDGLRDVEDESERARLAVQIFGTQAEDIGVGAITSLTTEGFEDIAGAAEDAATSMTDTLGGAVAEIQQEVDDLAVAFFNSEQIDIQGKLDAIKTAIRTFIDEINSGATFGEALEIALNAPGLEASFADFEAIVGNLAIAIMQGAAAILDAVGQGSAASDLRESIAEMSGGQLTFDLSVANDAQSVTDSINRAISRGVDPASIETSLQTAFDEALASGDLIAAQSIIDAVNLSAGLSQGLRDALTSGNIVNSETVQMLADELGISFDEAVALVQSGEARQMALTPTLDIDTTQMQVDVAQAAIDTQQAINEALASGDVSGAAALAANIGSSLQAEFDRLIATGQFDLAAIIAAGTGDAAMMEEVASAAEMAGMSDEEIATLQANAQTAVDTTTAAADQILENTTTIETETTAALEETSTAYTTFSDTSASAFTSAGDAATSYSSTVDSAMQTVRTTVNSTIETVQSLISAFQDAENAASEVGDYVVVNPTAGQASGTSPGQPARGTFWTGEEGPEIVSTNTDLSVLNNETSMSILSGLAELFSGGLSGGGSTVEIYQNNTFNNNGAAASNASLENTSKAIRGY